MRFRVLLGRDPSTDWVPVSLVKDGEDPVRLAALYGGAHFDEEDERSLREGFQVSVAASDTWYHWGVWSYETPDKDA